MNIEKQYQGKNITLLVNRIENNNESNLYCKDITNISLYYEKEIMITFNSIYF